MQVGFTILVYDEAYARRGWSQVAPAARVRDARLHPKLRTRHGASVTGGATGAHDIAALYTREAVLGASGGDMALVVEENAAATAAQSQLRAASEGSHGFSVEARKVFENEVQANPAWVLAEVDLEARWRAFAGSLAREVKEASERPLPRFCVSEGCITHRIVDCRYTACGWHWSKSQCVTANDAVVSCKKCSGASIRWGSA